MHVKTQLSRLLAAFVFAVVCWILSLSSAHANCALLKERGNTVYPFRTDKIRMVSAKVTVQMKRYGKAHVSCDFVLENTSPEEVTAKMGFPGRVDDGTHSGYALDLRYFETFVDGEKEKVLKLKQVLDKAEVARLQTSSEAFRHWYTWDVVFPPAKQVRIRSSHETALQSDQYEDTFECIMAAGAKWNWQGKVEEAEMEIVYDNVEELEARFISAHPGSYTVDANKIKWKFIDFVPKENIHIVERSYLQRGRR